MAIAGPTVIWRLVQGDSHTATSSTGGRQFHIRIVARIIASPSQKLGMAMKSVTMPRIP